MKKVILIGKPIAHSLSPLMHNHWLKELGIDGHYEARLTEPHEVEGLVERLKAGELDGINATIPHKEALFALAAKTDAAAQKIGGVNTLYIRDGVLTGKNTDAEGFIENLKYQAPEWKPEGQALILGAGAAARAAILALIDAGQKNIAVTARNPEKAEALKAHFPEADIQTVSWDQKNDAANETSLLVNATPMGLPGMGPVDFNLGNLKKEALVYDLVYGPEKTDFLKSAAAEGLKPIDGLGMLVFQGIPAFEAWFGQRPKFDEGLLDLLRKGM